MDICVLLSAADLDDRYTVPAREFAELLGKGGHTTRRRSSVVEVSALRWS